MTHEPKQMQFVQRAGKARSAETEFRATKHSRLESFDAEIDRVAAGLEWFLVESVRLVVTVVIGLAVGCAMVLGMRFVAEGVPSISPLRAIAMFVICFVGIALFGGIVDRVNDAFDRCLLKRIRQ